MKIIWLDYLVFALDNRAMKSCIVTARKSRQTAKETQPSASVHVGVENPSKISRSGGRAGRCQHYAMLG